MFILGLVVVVGVFTLLFRAGDRGGGSATFAIAKVFEVGITLGPADRAAVEENIRRAETRRGVSPEEQKLDLSDVSPSRLTRLLWVDDHPENNLYETIALERLGFVVTVATSTEDALLLAEELPIEIVVSDLGRGKEALAGFDLARRLRDRRSPVPIIIYTADAYWSEEARAAGVRAVVDTPRELLREIHQNLGTAKSRQ